MILEREITDDEFVYIQKDILKKIEDVENEINNNINKIEELYKLAGLIEKENVKLCATIDKLARGLSVSEYQKFIENHKNKFTKNYE